MACTLRAGMSMWSSNSSRACFSLRSSSSSVTYRSSPQNRCTLAQSIRADSVARKRISRLPLPPPVKTTNARPRAATAASTTSINLSPAAATSPSLSVNVSTSVLIGAAPPHRCALHRRQRGSRVLHPVDALQRGKVDGVGIQSPEIFGEAFRDVPALQWNQCVGFGGAAQRRGEPLLWSAQRHSLGGAHQLHLEFADDPADGSVDAAGQPT